MDVLAQQFARNKIARLIGPLQVVFTIGDSCGNILGMDSIFGQWVGGIDRRASTGEGMSWNIVGIIIISFTSNTVGWFLCHLGGYTGIRDFIPS